VRGVVEIGGLGTIETPANRRCRLQNRGPNVPVGWLQSPRD
jgi:hypothetical protein